MVCYPVEGLFIDCVVKSITKAGVRAELREIPTPMVIFIARDHNYGDEQFSKLQMNQQIQVKVIGQRFEINDPSISVIAQIIGSGR